MKTGPLQPAYYEAGIAIMLEKEKLRKADIFSGSIIFLLGLWIISQAVQMPMKDSYGGVQNVWYVSPALFPLFVGSMIMLLGALLIRTALREIGRDALRQALGWLSGTELLVYLRTAAVMRFYAMVVLFLSYVYLMIPRVDFFLCSVLFLMVFISMFYMDDDLVLKKLFFFYLAGAGLTLCFFSFSLASLLNKQLAYPGDWLMLVFIMAMLIYTWTIIRNRKPLRKKYRLCLFLSLSAPLTIGFLFKYLLLVPMPTEGLIVAVLDAIWYWDF